MGTHLLGSHFSLVIIIQREREREGAIILLFTSLQRRNALLRRERESIVTARNPISTNLPPTSGGGGDFVTASITSESHPMAIPSLELDLPISWLLDNLSLVPTTGGHDRERSVTTTTTYSTSPSLWRRLQMFNLPMQSSTTGCLKQVTSLVLL